MSDSVYSYGDEPVKADPEDFAELKVGRVLRTNFPNRAMRQYCTRHVFITGKDYLKWERGAGFGNIFGDRTNQSVDPFLERIAEMDGVTEISCSSSTFGRGAGAYAISVYKAPAFAWEELEPEIFRILVERDDMMRAQFGK